MSLKMFNNLLVYRLTEASKFHIGREELNAALAAKPARLPTLGELKAEGFNEPLGIEDEFIEEIRPYTYLLSVNFAERMLPGKIVRQRVQTRVKKLEVDEERKVYAREKQQIKDAVIAEMLPHTFIDQKLVRVLVSGPYIFIDATSAKKGEDVLCLLREVLGTLGVKPVTVKGTPIQSFTDWFTGRTKPEKFRLTGDFKANNDVNETDFVTGKGTSPKDEGLSDLVLEFQRRVTVLGLYWETSMNEDVSFTVNEMIGIKGIKWPDAIMDMAAQDAGEEAEQINLMRATLLLLSAEMVTLLDNLLDALGGEEVPDNGSSELDDLYSAAFKHITHVNGVPVGKQGWTPPEPGRIPSDLAGHEDDEGEDALLIKVTAWVKKSERCSISAIQREFKLGYNRAARIVECLETLGVVTEMNSNGAREVIRQRDDLNSNIAKLLDDTPDVDEDEEDLI